jgi:hypothetical protein
MPDTRHGLFDAASCNLDGLGGCACASRAAHAATNTVKTGTEFSTTCHSLLSQNHTEQEFTAGAYTVQSGRVDL